MNKWGRKGKPKMVEKKSESITHAFNRVTTEVSRLNDALNKTVDELKAIKERL